MASVHPYLTFNGNCEEAFNFYKSVFGGEFPYLGRFNEMPAAEGQPKVGADEGNKIMHVSLPIGNTMLMGSDSSDEYGHATVIGNNFSLSFVADSKEHADTIYAALSAGGQQTMPMNDTFWGSYFGMLTDKFQINWMVSYDAARES